MYLERRPVSINEELITPSVPVAPTPGRVSEQSVGKPVERPLLCLVALSADVNDDALAARLEAVMWNAYVHRGMTGRLVTVRDL